MKSSKVMSKYAVFISASGNTTCDNCDGTLYWATKVMFSEGITVGISGFHPINLYPSFSGADGGITCVP